MIHSTLSTLFAKYNLLKFYGFFRKVLCYTCYSGKDCNNKGGNDFG